MLTLITASVPPVSLDDAKEHLRVSGSDDDALIASYIAAACATVAEMSGRVLAEETWQLAIPSTCGDLALPLAPVQDVTDIDYYDATGADTAAVVSDFYLFKDADTAILRPKDGKAWPATQAREDALRITFTVGYADLPVNLLHAIYLLVGHFYANREAAGETVSAVPFGVESLVGLSRRGWLKA